MKKIEFFLLALIILLGIGLRSPEVLNKNFLFGFDQGRDYLAVEKIILEQKPTLIGSEVGAGFAGLGGIFHGPYYFYSLIPSFLLFKGDPYGGLVLMFLFGVAALFLCFVVTQKIFGTKAALVTTLLLGVSPLISSQSRFMWNHHPTTVFILIAFWFTYKILENPQKYFFLATFFAGIIYGFELAISIPLIITQFIFVFFVLKIRSVKSYLFGIGGVFLSYLPFFLFEARHGFMATKSIFGVFSGQMSGKVSFDYARVFADHLVNFWHNFRNTFLLDPKLAFLLLILMLIITHNILRRKQLKRENPFIAFLLILPFSSLVLFWFLNNAIWDYYLIHLHLVYIFLFAFYLTTIKIPLAKVGLLFFLILTIPGVFGEIKRAINDYYDYGGTAKIKGKIAAIDYIYHDAKGERFNVLVFTPPVYDYAYRYLLTWYGGKKYRYIPGAEKKGIFYLWIEPEISGIWHKGWLETVVKTGEILKEEKLPNGFIIQKRYAEEN